MYYLLISGSIVYDKAVKILLVDDLMLHVTIISRTAHMHAYMFVITNNM
jgi:hypothetical protein